jgi:hypothetical protein
MPNTTLIAAIAAVLSHKFSAEPKAEPQAKSPTPKPYCMGMDCCCGAGPCPAASAANSKANDAGGAE